MNILSIIPRDHSTKNTISKNILSRLTDESFVILHLRDIQLKYIFDRLRAFISENFCAFVKIFSFNF